MTQIKHGQTWRSATGETVTILQVMTLFVLVEPGGSMHVETVRRLWTKVINAS